MIILRNNFNIDFAEVCYVQRSVASIFISFDLSMHVNSPTRYTKYSSTIIKLFPVFLVALLKTMPWVQVYLIMRQYLQNIQLLEAIVEKNRYLSKVYSKNILPYSRISALLYIYETRLKMCIHFYITKNLLITSQLKPCHSDATLSRGNKMIAKRAK